MPVTLSFHDLRRLFEPVVRVRLAWEAIARSDAFQIESFVVDQAARFDDWYFPWYVDSRGARVEPDDPGARPMRASEAHTELVVQLPGVADAERVFAESLGVPPMLWLAYRLPKGFLLLDGNHRLAALLRTALPFTALVFCLDGPLETRYLPDLRHWQS